MFHKTVRLVTFDITHTLMHFRLSPGQQYAQVAARCGIQLDVEDVTKRFKRNYLETSKKFPNFGRSNSVLWEEWWRIVVRKTFEGIITDKRTVEDVATELIESYKTKEYWQLNNGCIDILEFLKSTGVVLGVISNFDPRLKEILKNSGLHQYFNFVLTSYEAGFAKPESEIFLKALLFSRLVKMYPCSALHIGDNIEVDYLGAKRSGWQAAIITDCDTNHPDLHHKCQHLFNNLSNLKDHLYEHKDIFQE